MKEGDLCSMHAKKNGTPHGLVTGPIPFNKLQDFVNREMKETRGAKRTQRGAGLWYVRHLMWAQADRVLRARREEEDEAMGVAVEEAGEKSTLAALRDEEYERCLQHVHNQLRMHPQLVVHVL